MRKILQSVYTSEGKGLNLVDSRLASHSLDCKYKRISCMSWRKGLAAAIDCHFIYWFPNLRLLSCGTCPRQKRLARPSSGMLSYWYIYMCKRIFCRKQQTNCQESAEPLPVPKNKEFTPVDCHMASHSPVCTR
jgi:hypothetical protein